MGSVSQSPKSIAYRLVKFQAQIAFVIILFLGLFMGMKGVTGAFFASIISIGANLFFINRTLRCQSARAAKQILFSFMYGELMKLVLIALGLTIALVYFKAAVLPLLLTYVLLQVALLFAPVLKLGMG